MQTGNSFASNPYFIVAKDGSGNFTTIQQALNAITNEGIEVISSELLRDITPGLIAVFYDEDEVVGSGIIQMDED